MGLNVMLQKQVGNLNVEKLWITVLFEADFNMNSKWIGRVVMYTAEKMQALVLEQYGNWKSKATNIQNLNKRLFYDIIQFSQQMVVLCSNVCKELL